MKKELPLIVYCNSSLTHQNYICFTLIKIMIYVRL